MILPQVAVGIGNTSVKLGLTPADHASGWPLWSVQREFATSAFDPVSLADLLPAKRIDWFVASVQRTVELQLRAWVQTTRSQDRYHLLAYQDLPIEVNVEAPPRVGLDRLAAAVGANFLRDPARHAIIIDAGTAITVNLVTPDGVFQGGVILPGVALTAKALVMGTDLLPLVPANLDTDPPTVIGKSPEDAIRSGLFWGNVGAVREIVNRVQQDLDSPAQIFVTGGGARRFAESVAIDARFVPDLVLGGIIVGVEKRRSS